MPTCGSCGNEEPEASRFCGNCGAPFVPADQPTAGTAATSRTTLTCPSCGNEEPEGARYCGSCSAPLTPTDRPAPRRHRSRPRRCGSSPAWSRRRRSSLLRSPPAAGGRRSRWIAVGAVAVLLVAGGVARRRAPDAATKRDEVADHGAATATNRHVPAPATVFEPDARRHRCSPPRAALELAGCAHRSGPPARAGGGLVGRGAAGGRGARLRRDGDAAVPRRPGSGRQRGGKCARADASRACGPSRIRGGGLPLPRSAPVLDPRTGAGGDRTGRGGAARLREPQGRRPGSPGRLHERLRQQRAARGRAGTEADAVASDTTRDRPRPAARGCQAGRSTRRGPVLRAVHVEGVAPGVGRRAPERLRPVRRRRERGSGPRERACTASPDRRSRRLRGSLA